MVKWCTDWPKVTEADEASPVEHLVADDSSAMARVIVRAVLQRVAASDLERRNGNFEMQATPEPAPEPDSDDCQELKADTSFESCDQHEACTANAVISEYEHCSLNATTIFRAVETDEFKVQEELDRKSHSESIDASAQLGPSNAFPDEPESRLQDEVSVDAQMEKSDAHETHHLHQADVSALGEADGAVPGGICLDAEADVELRSRIDEVDISSRGSELAIHDHEADTSAHHESHVDAEVTLTERWHCDMTENVNSDAGNHSGVMEIRFSAERDDADMEENIYTAERDGDSMPDTGMAENVYSAERDDDAIPPQSCHPQDEEVLRRPLHLDINDSESETELSQMQTEDAGDSHGVVANNVSARLGCSTLSPADSEPEVVTRATDNVQGETADVAFSRQGWGSTPSTAASEPIACSSTPKNDLKVLETPRAVANNLPEQEQESKRVLNFELAGSSSADDGAGAAEDLASEHRRLEPEQQCQWQAERHDLPQQQSSEPEFDNQAAHRASEAACDNEEEDPAAKEARLEKLRKLVSLEFDGRTGLSCDEVPASASSRPSAPAKEPDAGGVLHATDVEFDLDSEPGNDRPDFDLSGIWLMTTDRNSKFEYAWRHEAGSSQFSGFQLTSNGRADPIKLPLSGSVSRDGVVQWFIEGVCCTGKLEDDGHGIADGQFWRTSTKEQLGTFHGQMVFAGIETATRASELGLGRADCQAGSTIEQRATRMHTPSQERRRSTLSRLCCCFSKPRSTGSSGSMPREAPHERRGHSVDEPDTSVD
jgi:hypothetical protein